jgi:hypothetical protein
MSQELVPLFSTTAYFISGPDIHTLIIVFLSALLYFNTSNLLGYSDCPYLKSMAIQKYLLKNFRVSLIIKHSKTPWGLLTVALTACVVQTGGGSVIFVGNVL